MDIWRARPLPEPVGTMPRATGVLQSARAVSFTVPSPPHASTPKTPFSTPLRARRVASPAHVVYSVQTSKPAAQRRRSICSATPFLDVVPETGFIIRSSLFPITFIRCKDRNFSEHITYVHKKSLPRALSLPRAGLQAAVRVLITSGGDIDIPPEAFFVAVTCPDVRQVVS